MTITVVRAQGPDSVEMATLEQALFPHDAWSLDQIVSELAHPDSYYLVARDDPDGALIAYGGLRASEVVHHQGDIQTLAVSPNYRGNGLGRRLLGELLTEAWRRGVAEVLLEVRADNDPAIRLYSREGFHEIARRPGYYQPGCIDAIVMRMARPASEETL
jgi:ribosomal-protein-alanine N-acetyltransferase